MKWGFSIGAATDVGVGRDLNQDSYRVGPGVVVVADGMGGHRGGEVASSIAAREMVDRFDRPDLSLLVQAVEHANRRILDEAASNPMLHGMGTTVVALGFIDVEDGVSLGAINVGDSRMYRLTGVVLEQLTEDHSLVEALVREGRLTPEQAEVHPQRNIVTRALGVLEHVEVDSFHFIPKLGDRYLLCSDGLFNEVSAQEIATILATYADPQETAQALVTAANAGGGRDNITTVIVDIVDAAQAAMPETAMALASDIHVDRSPTPADPSADIIEFDVPNLDLTDPVDVVVPDISEAAVASGDPADSADRSGKQRWSWRR